jgi:hypothetical protein
MEDVFYTVETVFNGRREFPIELSLETIAHMRNDPRYTFVGEPVEMSYRPSHKMADCAKWGNE